MLQCLLIDGSLTIQKVIKLALSKYDVNVSSLNSLHEASVFISSAGAKIDFIISDSFLEGTVNPQSLKKLSIQAHAPILILNGSYQGVDEVSFKQEGFFFFLKKPFETASLISSIESLIKKPLPLKEGVSVSESDNNNQTPPSFTPPKPPVENRTEINIPPTISFKEELSLQEKMESMEFSSNSDSFKDNDSTLKTKLPPPPPGLGGFKVNESFSKDISIKEEINSNNEDISIPPNPFSSKPSNLPPPFVPNIPVGKQEVSNKDSGLEGINLPPPPFIKKEVPTSEVSKGSSDVFSKNLPPIPNIDLKHDSSAGGTYDNNKSDVDTVPNIENTPPKDIPFSPSKKYLEENIEKIVKEYINSSLEELVKKEVQNYCDAHFKNIATECIKDKINKLLEEKVSLSEDS